MKKMLLLVLGLGVLSACTAAKMAIDPELKMSSYQYEIMEKPRLTGDKVKFGPYLASNINRKWMRGSGTTIGSFKDKKATQKYTYDFMGESSWKASCQMKSKGKTIGAVGFGHETSLNCSFSSTGEKKSTFEFTFSGPSLVEAKGYFNAGKENFRVAVIDKIEGSPLRLGSPIGYSFYAGEKLIAGVNIINRKGPVLLNKELSGDVKDRVSLVMVALLLFKEKSKS